MTLTVVTRAFLAFFKVSFSFLRLACLVLAEIQRQTRQNCQALIFRRMRQGYRSLNPENYSTSSRTELAHFGLLLALLSRPVYEPPRQTNHNQG